MSEYAHAYPAVRPHGDGWRTDVEMRGESEGLLWVVRTQEGEERAQDEERLRDKLSDLGLPLPSMSQSADEYILADRVELKPNGSLIFELGTPQHIVSVKAYAHGQWREFHLLSDPHEIAGRTATMLKENEDAEA